MSTKAGIKWILKLSKLTSLIFSSAFLGDCSENNHNSYRKRFGQNSNDDNDDYYDDNDDDDDIDNKSWVTTYTFIQTAEGLAKQTDYNHCPVLAR